MTTSDCIFCQIVNGKAPAEVVWEMDWRGVIGIVPLNPVTPGHVIFIPRVHATDFADLPVVTGKTVETASWYATSQPGDANLITSKGADATQSVFHLHVHYVPRTRDDGLALPWYSGKGNHV